jgi:hypothetical protein
MDQSVIDQLTSIAPFLQRLEFDPDARMFYEYLADALIWYDEVPDMAEFMPKVSDSNARDPLSVPIRPTAAFAAVFGQGCMRSVWHYRSSLICGMPASHCEEAWREALRLFFCLARGYNTCYHS